MDCQAHRDGTTGECDHEARFKWGHSGHYVDDETVALAEDDPRLDGRVFIQQEDDPYGFVDGDDLRCPETGEVHPEFIRIPELWSMSQRNLGTAKTVCK